MASKVIKRAVQYCRLDLYAVRDLHKQSAVKLKVNNVVWNRLKQLDIRDSVRGCRGGAHLIKGNSLVTTRGPQCA